MDTSEKNFETTIEEALLSGGYRRREPGDYDKVACLIRADVLDFIYATQPKVWERLKQQFNGNVDEAKANFFQRLTSEVRRQGTLTVMRKGIKTLGCHFRLAYFRPAERLNPELQRLYAANIFSVVRQLRYSEQNSNSLDLTIFLNGLPIFTAELKNDLSGQDVQDAVRQYRTTRDPAEPLFAYGRCLAHFAVDPEYVYVSTQLARERTQFLPFNRGKNGGAGNPAAAWGSFATAYLWEAIWERASVLELVQRFIHEVEEEVTERGRKSIKRRILFPRYHQLDTVRRLIADARAQGTGQRYLIQHSAGSGKSNTLTWLAHHLSVLHDDHDAPIFNSVIIISDRRILDHQLQQTVRQFEQTIGVVQNIDKDSQQLKDALESGKKIVVTTLQKFPVIVNEIGSLAGKKFAVIIDEAHSSQTGEDTSSMKKALTALSLNEARDEDEEDEENSEPEDLEDRIAADMRSRGRIPNASFFAFTATPKPRTLELFGQRRSDGRYEPFSLYTMRQAIEEGFILDVLQNYTTYRAYWNLLKKIESDPHYERSKAHALLRAFVEGHEQTIATKVEIMIEHFHSQVAPRIDGKAKAMIVTSSRRQAVRYYHQVRQYLERKGYPYKVLVAFSGRLTDGGIAYSEAELNRIPESKTAETFKRDEYRILIVANKFQTGFDQPLLHTMYVDKKLGGVHAVQTLSRLNRTHPNKEETMVLDFANEAEQIRAAFQPYYEKTLLSQGTDPNLLYDLQAELAGYGLYNEEDIQRFAAVYFNRKATQDRLQAVLKPVAERCRAASVQVQQDFRHQLTSYTHLYAFLAQIVSFADTDLTKLYYFGKYLLRKLPAGHDQLPVDIQQNIALDSYRLQQTSKGRLILERGAYELVPIVEKERAAQPLIEELEPLSRIIEEVNTRFGTTLSDEARHCLHEIETRLNERADLAASMKVNAPDNAWLSFKEHALDLFQDMINDHFKFYKQVNDDPAVADFILNWLFTRYRERQQSP